jgi:hypothetical protein
MGIPRPEDQEKDHSLVLEASLEEWSAYWDEQGPLTAEGERRKRLEEEWRRNLVAAGSTPAEMMPASWLIRDIRSGKYERDYNRWERNLWRNQVRRAMWRRQGYTFDAEHRLVAPPGRQPRVPTRPVTVAARPRERARGRSRVTRAGPSDDSEPPPAAAGPSHPVAVATALHRDILGRLYFIAEVLEDGDAGMAHAIALDAIDDLRGAAA